MTDTTTPSSANAGTPYGTLPPASPLPQRRPVSLYEKSTKLDPAKPTQPSAMAAATIIHQMGWCSA